VRNDRFYLVHVSVRWRLFWAAACGLMSYDLLTQPMRRSDDYIFAVLFGTGLSVLCVLAFVAAMRLLWLKVTLTFWH
jgi:CHASE2 domain-containing sensor protein